MHIANPIYDVVFKYLLEDNKVAKLFLSAIIGEQITELEFSAQEQTVEVQPSRENVPITVIRFDFSAKIKTPEGFKTIGIELQKAKFLSDLMRFRRYLGLRYQNSANTYLEVVAHKTKKKKVKQEEPKIEEKPRQIYCIYFLAYGMDLPACPVLKVDYRVEDAYSGEEFPSSGEFVAGLHHRSWIVQINELKERRRNNLEKLLAVFDQSAQINKYILDVDDESIPEAYREIIRRLRKAMEDPVKRREMELEDDIVNEFKDKERQIEKAKKTITEQSNTIVEKDNTIAEQSNTIAEKDNTIAEQGNTIEAQAKRIADLERKLILNRER
jgi:membrane-associated HD superfamily phosphohydrolase